MAGAQENGALLRPMPPDMLITSGRSKSAAAGIPVRPREVRTEANKEPLAPNGSDAALLRPVKHAPLVRHTLKTPSKEPFEEEAMSAFRAAAEQPSVGELDWPADPLAGLEQFMPELLSEADDEWPDDEEEDAVPTSAMPMPVSVPLYDLSTREKPRKIGLWIVLGLVAVLAVAGALCWKAGLLPPL